MSVLSYGVQSHHRFSVMTFRVVFLSLTFSDVSSQLWRSESSSSSVWCSKPHLQLGIQSHYPFTVWRSEPSSYSVWRSEPHLQLSVRVTIPSQFDVQSPHLFQFGIQSRHIFSVTKFRVILLSLTFRDVSSQLWCSEPPSPYSLAFIAIIASQLWHSESCFSVWHSEMLVLSYGIQSLHLLQFGVQSCISNLAFRVTIPS